MRKIAYAALVVVCATLVIAPGGLAAKSGNSANAKLCQKGGWTNWLRGDQTSFVSHDECVNYGAKGGTLTPTPAQLLCESYGGTHVGPGSTYAWECNSWSVSSGDEFGTKRDTLEGICASNNLDVSAEIPGVVSVQCRHAV
jgi:hypothetical protein